MNRCCRSELLTHRIRRHSLPLPREHRGSRCGIGARNRRHKIWGQENGTLTRNHSPYALEILPLQFYSASHVPCKPPQPLTLHSVSDLQEKSLNQCAVMPCFGIFAQRMCTDTSCVERYHFGLDKVKMDEHREQGFLLRFLACMAAHVGPGHNSTYTMRCPGHNNRYTMRC